MDSAPQGREVGNPEEEHMKIVTRREWLAAAGTVAAAATLSGSASAQGAPSVDDLVRAVTPLNIQGASGSPLRAIALAP